MFTILLNATLNLSIHDQFELENHTEILKTNGINISLLTVKDIRLGPEKDFFTTITLPTDYSLTDSILEKLNKDTISPRIISYALSHDVDIIVTDNKKLLKVKYDIKHLINIVITSSKQFFDYLDIISVGNNIFLVHEYTQCFGFNLYCSKQHPAAKYFFDLYSKHANSIANPTTKNEIRNILLNRYPYILYARYLIKYHELLDLKNLRNNSLEASTMITGYHVNAFYLQIWGMLDHLAKIISAIYELDISEIGSGFSSKKFKTKLKTKQPELHSTIYTSKTEAWINTLAQIRHQAAHNYIHLPTDIVRDTPDSKKTDHEISEILKTSGELDDLDEETKKILLPILINNWRIDKRERIGSGMISVKGKKKPFLYPVINSIDYELEQLNNILKIIFNFVFDLQPPSETPPQH